MKKSFTDRSWKDYTRWAESDAVITGKINSMLKAIEEGGAFEKEPAADSEGVIYVLNIDEINQLALRLNEDVLEILSCKGQLHMAEEESR